MSMTTVAAGRSETSVVFSLRELRKIEDERMFEEQRAVEKQQNDHRREQARLEQERAQAARDEAARLERLKLEASIQAEGAVSLERIAAQERVAVKKLELEIARAVAARRSVATAGERGHIGRVLVVGLVALVCVVEGYRLHAAANAPAPRTVMPPAVIQPVVGSLAEQVATPLAPAGEVVVADSKPQQLPVAVAPSAGKSSGARHSGKPAKPGKHDKGKQVTAECANSSDPFCGMPH